MNYTGIILDVDGTIWNTTELVATAWNRAFADTSVPVAPVTADILKTQFGKTMDVIGKNLFPQLPDDERAELLKKCCIEEHIEVEANTRNIMYEGVYETIKSLSKKVPFYIVSNCQSGYIELMLKKTGMTSFIKDFECFGNTGHGKADNLKLLVDRNSIEKPVYIGDTQGDSDECRKAGVPFVWAEYGFGNGVTGFVSSIKTFAETISLI